MHWHLAPKRRALAPAAHPLARSEPSGGGQSGGIQSFIQRVLLPERKAELGGERRLGAAVRRGREPAPPGRVQEEVLVGPESAARPSPGAAGTTPQQLPHENFSFLRV